MIKDENGALVSCTWQDALLAIAKKVGVFNRQEDCVYTLDWLLVFAYMHVWRKLISVDHQASNVTCVNDLYDMIIYIYLYINIFMI